jgi:acetyltransferase-like isoleucine patch superfamily enzyme
MTSATEDTRVADRLRLVHGPALTLGEDCELPDDLVIELDPDARLTIGHHVSIRRGTTIQVHRRATVAIGDYVAIGENVFLSAMVGIRLGTGCALSNYVDIHDHNHRERSAANVPDGQLTPWASGFEAAPIVIEPGAIISNKVSVTAGVRVGANSLIGANAVVSRSIPPDTVAAGVPAVVRRRIDGTTIAVADDRRTLTIGFFGTSIMEHLEGFNVQLTNQANLPEIGSKVTVEGWRQRGWVHRLALDLRAGHPQTSFDFRNYGEGGATSRDIAGIVERTLQQEAAEYDLVFLGCGINDVWRGFQGRTAEAVDLQEYIGHLTTMLTQLKRRSRRLIVVSETPFGPIDKPETVAAMNIELTGYNRAAAKAAADHGAVFLDVWAPFTAAARQLAAAPVAHESDSLWSDGVHLTELGDTVLLRAAERLLDEQRIIDALLDYPRLERDLALRAYAGMFAPYQG